MREATKVTPSNLNFYEDIFNWKQSTGKRIVLTEDGFKVIPRKKKLGGLSRASKNTKTTQNLHQSKQLVSNDPILPLKNEPVTSIRILKTNTYKDNKVPPMENNLSMTTRNNASMILGISDFDASSFEIKRPSPKHTLAEEIAPLLDTSTHPDKNTTGT